LPDFEAGCVTGELPDSFAAFSDELSGEAEGDVEGEEDAAAELFALEAGGWPESFVGFVAS
jgi:hypothetical protein